MRSATVVVRAAFALLSAAVAVARFLIALEISPSCPLLFPLKWLNRTLFA